MNLKKLLRKNESVSPAVKASLAYTICSILQKTLSLITTPLFSRLLTVEQYGQLSIYNSWSAIIAIFITLNLNYGSFNRAMVKYEDDRNGYISSIQTLVVGLSLLFFGIYLPFTKFFNNLFSLSTSLVVLLVVEVVAQFGLSLWLGKNRYEYKYKSVVLVTILMSILSPIAAFILIKYMQEKGVARILGYALVYIVIGGAIFLKNYFSGKKIFSKEYWKYAFTFNIPLLIYYVSQMIFNQSDRIMIEKLCGMEDAGLYSMAYTFALIMTFVLNAIDNSYIPWLYDKIRTGKHKDNPGMSIIITIIMCILIGGIIWITPEAILLMGGQKYMSSIYVVAPISISLILLLFTSFSTNIQFFYEKKYSLIIASVGAALLNIGLNYIFIPIFGFIAAGYTTLASYIVFCISNYFVVRKVIGKNGKLEGIYDIKSLISLFILFVILSYVGVLLYPYRWIRYAIIACVILLLIIFRRSVSKMAKSIIKNKTKVRFVDILKAPLRLIKKIIYKIQAKIYLKKKFYIDGKCKILFICQCQHIWQKMESVVGVLSKNDKFDVSLLIVEDEGVIDDTVFEKYAKENGLKFYKYKKGILKEILPNIIFYPRPYDGYLPRELRTNRTVKKAKLFYVPYGYSFMKLGDVNLSKEFTQNLSVLIADNDYAHNIFESRKYKKYQQSYNVGCPYLEDFLEKYNKTDSEENLYNKIDNKGFKVMWTPRWVTDENLGGSNFFRYIDNIFDTLVDNKFYSFVFRPHPYAFSNFIKNGLISEERRDNYINRIKNSSNSFYDDTSEYVNTLLNADVLLTDVSSIIAEYALTGKPIIFCHNENGEILNEIAEKFCEKVFYNAYNFDDIKKYLDDLSQGIDPLKETRENFCLEYKKSFDNINKKIEKIVEETVEKSFNKKEKK